MPVPSAFEGLPVVTAARMRELDRLATERFGVAVLDLMENAGRAVADETVHALEAKGRRVAGALIVVCCGRGANGGDGLVAARILKKDGAKVSVYICPPRKEGDYPDPVRINLERAKEAGVWIRESGPESGLRAKLAAADCALDALLGTGAAGKPAGAIHHMIVELNASRKPVFAVDIPSGLDPDTGEAGASTVLAAATFTLGLAKRGLLAPRAKKHVGTLKVLEIGYPKGLFKEGATTS